MESARSLRHLHLKTKFLSKIICRLKLLIFYFLLSPSIYGADISALSFETLIANFDQHVISQSNVSEIYSNGKIIIKKPDSIIWHIKNPFERVIKINDESINIYDPDLKQVINTNIDQFGDGDWINILLGDNSLEDRYKKSKEEKGLTTRIRFDSLAQDSHFSHIIIDTLENKIQTIEIIQSKDQRLLIRLNNVLINQVVDDYFTNDLIPLDTEVISQ